MRDSRQDVPLRCPIHHDELIANGSGELVGSVHGKRYPIVDGIPVLLPEGVGDSAEATFYNDPVEMETYFRHNQPVDRAALEDALRRIEVDGPTLEIGSGRGALQGIGEPYVALDFSLTALRSWVKPEYQRVCGSADKLPFFDNTFKLVFSVACLEHVPDAATAFEEIHRVLKPGGIAHINPAWHCVQYNCDGVPVRPYRDLSLRNKFVKATLPLRQSALFKGLSMIPGRALRRVGWSLGGRKPTTYHFKRLRPDYNTFWTADSDACSRLDSHEASLFFLSRGYEIIQPGKSLLRQLTLGSGALVVQKR